MFILSLGPHPSFCPPPPVSFCFVSLAPSVCFAICFCLFFSIYCFFLFLFSLLFYGCGPFRFSANQHDVDGKGENSPRWVTIIEQQQKHQIISVTIWTVTIWTVTTKSNLKKTEDEELWQHDTNTTHIMLTSYRKNNFKEKQKKNDKKTNSHKAKTTRTHTHTPAVLPLKYTSWKHERSKNIPKRGFSLSS